MHTQSSHQLPQVFAASLVLIAMWQPETAAAQSSVIYFHSDDDQHLFRPRCFDFMPDDRYLLLAGRRIRSERQAELRVWDFENERFVLEHWLDFPEGISTIDVAPDSETLLVASHLEATVDSIPAGYDGLDNVWLWRMQAEPGRDEESLLRSSIEPIRRLQTADSENSPIHGQAILSEDARKIAVRRRDGGGPGTPGGGANSIIILNQSGRVLNILEMPY